MGSAHLPYGPPWLRALMVVGLSSLGACGGAKDLPSGRKTDVGRSDESARENKPSATRLCTAYCDRRQHCGLGPKPDCVARCAADHQDSRHVRIDFAWHLLGCLDTVECTSLAQGQAFKACHASTTRRLDITAALRRFCFQSARKGAQCGRREDVDQSECLDRFRYLEDEVLAEGLECVDKPCAQVPACFGERFGTVK